MPGNNNSTFTNNNNTSIDSGLIIVDGQTYTLARSETFYYLQFINYDKELFKNASNLTSKPTIVFYNDGTDKAIVDYTLASTTDKLYINSFFANLTANTDAFNVTKGTYLDASELEADVTCGLTFTSYTDYKAFGKVVSVTNRNAALDVYFGDYFVGTPQLSKSGSLGYNESTIDYALVSVNPNTSKPLSYLGITGGDIIEVINSNSTNNGYKFKINEITTLNNKEVVRLVPAYAGSYPTLESLIGQESTINVYVKGTTTSTADFDGDVGCCYNSAQKIENSTEYQCSLRPGYSYSGSICSLVVPPASATTTTTSYKTIVNTYNTSSEVQSSNVVFDSYITYKDETTPALELRVTNTDGSLYLDNKKIILNSNKKYCFEQIDVSNIGFILRFSTTKDFYTPYTTGIYSAIRYEGINSFSFLRTNYNTYPELYVYLEYRPTSNPASSSPVLVSTDYYLSY